jgi:hypothetical protein
MRDIPPLVDDVIALTMCKWPDLWAEWRTFAYMAGKNYPNGLSQEEVARRLLADCWPGSPGFLSPKYLDHQIWIHDTLARVIDVLRSGEGRLIDSFRRPIPLKRITPESFRFDSGDIVIDDDNETRFPSARLVPASQDVNEAPPESPPTLGAVIYEASAPQADAAEDRKKLLLGACRAVYKVEKEEGRKPPNKDQAVPLVRGYLEKKNGIHATKKEIMPILERKEFADQRLRRGPTWKALVKRK